MTDAERRALSTIIRSLADLFGVCEPATRALMDNGHGDLAMRMAKASVELTQTIVAAWPVLGVDPSLLVPRPNDTDASTN
jgi:hypothetical protein